MLPLIRVVTQENVALDVCQADLPIKEAACRHQAESNVRDKIQVLGQEDRYP
jgi:hypothetical protein